MNKDKIVAINDLWDMNVEMYGDKSTAWLIQFTADQADVEYATVVEALRKKLKTEESP